MKRLTAFDVETPMLGPGRQFDRPVVASFCNEGEAPFLLRGDAIAARVEGLLKDAIADRSYLINHEIAFDLGCIAYAWPHLESLIIQAYEADAILCTRLWSQLADFSKGRNWRDGYGIDSVARHLSLPVVPDKENPWRTRFGEFRNVPTDQWPQAAIDYCLTDAATPIAIGKSIPLVPDVGPQSRYAFWLKCSSAYGVIPDPPKVAAWAAELQSDAEQLREPLITKGLVEWDRKNDRWKANQKRLRKRMVATGNAKYTDPSSKFPRGQVCIDGTSCAESGDPLLEIYAVLSEKMYALNKEWPQMQTPIVHTQFGIAETGRSISEKPAMQNMSNASGGRQCFRPHDDNGCFIIFDFSKLELCTLAQLCLVIGAGGTLAKALIEGVDPHRLIAADILGCSYADAPDHPNYYYARQCAKGANFGYPGGMGPDSFIPYAKNMWDVVLTRAQSVSIKQTHERRWPDVVRYRQIVDRERCANDGTLEHYRSGRLRGKLSYTKGCNTLFQGLGGDVTKATGWALFKAHIPTPIFVHDEYVCEAKRRYAADVAQAILEIAERTAREWLPDVGCTGDPIAATRWVKSLPKGVKRTDDKGRVIIYEAS